jgi:hypothetical protein
MKNQSREERGREAGCISASRVALLRLHSLRVCMPHVASMYRNILKRLIPTGHFAEGGKCSVVCSIATIPTDIDW